MSDANLYKVPRLFMKCNLSLLSNEAYFLGCIILRTSEGMKPWNLVDRRHVDCNHSHLHRAWVHIGVSEWHQEILWCHNFFYISGSCDSYVKIDQTTSRGKVYWCETAENTRGEGEFISPVWWSIQYVSRSNMFSIFNCAILCMQSYCVELMRTLLPASLQWIFTFQFWPGTNDPSSRSKG